MNLSPEENLNIEEREDIDTLFDSPLAPGKPKQMVFDFIVPTPADILYEKYCEHHGIEIEEFDYSKPLDAQRLRVDNYDDVPF